MADYHYAMPQRKPLNTQTLPLRQPPQQPSHTHTRTVSSNIFPAPSSPNIPQQTYPNQYHPARRTPSTATASTTSSGQGPNRGPSTVSISLRRTPSARSGVSITPTSYVALLRKQKATVWCDRSQQTDPRIAAAQRAAKQRATLEVVGTTGRTGGAASVNSSGNGERGVRGKIRHHGGKNAVGYSPATLLVGASGMPARLSATEVGDENDSGDEATSIRRGNGSGRSSMGSGRVAALRTSTGFTSQGHVQGRMSHESTPPSGNDVSPIRGGTMGKEEETPVPGRMSMKGDYFAQERRKGAPGSGSSGEREEGFGGLGEMSAPKVIVSEGKKGEDLARRGSVDERAMTMRGPRLFVANPDNSDSD